MINYKKLKKLLVLKRKLITGKLKKKILGKNAIAILTSSENNFFLVEPTDMGVGRSLLKGRTYGSEELSLLKRILNKNHNVLVVGSHVGTISIPLSKHVKHLIAIEANPNCYNLLNLNILINKVNNIQTIKVAAADKSGEIDFIKNTINSGGSKRVPLIKDPMYYSDNPEIIKVKTQRLDDIVSSNIHLVFMDIEGSEFYALKGMPKILKEAKFLVMEFIPHHFKNVSGVNMRDLVDLLIENFDYLFIPSKKKVIHKVDFLNILQNMYENEEWDPGIVFSKEKWSE